MTIACGSTPCGSTPSDIVDVLIVEDRKQTAQRLENTIQRLPQFRVCQVTHTLAAGMRALKTRRPRAILVDLGLPDGSGVELIHAAEAADWQCDSLVITVFGDEARVIDAVRAGAKGYILKNDMPADLGRTLRAVLEGGSPISPQIARFLLSLVPQSPVLLDLEAPTFSLTAREQDILRLIARGFKRQEVAAKLHITIGTVGTHINNVYRKLEVSSNTEAVAMARRLGLV